MSSNCPPQLHLEIPPSTTSFKRSFDQFGFDLESPLGGPDALGASGSDGNDRNKRARSASSFSDDNILAGNPSSSTAGSGSSSSSTSDPLLTAASGSRSASPSPHSPSTLSAPHLSLDLPQIPLEPPRLPQIQDIIMADYPLVEAQEPRNPVSLPSGSAPPTVFHVEDNYRLTLERFSTFESEISVLRRSRSPSLARPETPPYILPPLQLSDEEINSTLRHTQRSPRIPDLSSQIQPTQDEARRESSRMPSSQPRRGDSSITSRDVQSEPSRLYGAWHSTTLNERAAAIDRRRMAWPYLYENPVSQSRNNEHDQELDEPIRPIVVRPISPIPSISELRTPSPLFDLEELRNTASASNRNTPPTLPPIHQHDEPWEVEMFAWDDLRPDTSTSAMQRTSQPPPLSRTSIPRDLSILRDRNDEGRSTGSTGESSNSGANTQTHTLPSPFTRDIAEWMGNGSSMSWFAPSPAEGRSSPNHFRTAMTSSSNDANANNPPNYSPHDSHPIDSYTASRLETLHGLGEALQGIGRALQESEMTLRPFMMDNGSTAENGRSSSTLLTQLEGASSSENRTALQHSDGSTSIARSSDLHQDENDIHTRRRRSRLSAPSLPSPLEDHMRPWLADRRSRAGSPLPPPSREPDVHSEDRRTTSYRHFLTEQSRQRSPSPQPPVSHQRTVPANNPGSSRGHNSSGLTAPSWFHAFDEAMANELSTPPAAQTSTVISTGERAAISPESSSESSLRTNSTPWIGGHDLEAHNPLPLNTRSHSRDEASLPASSAQSAADRYPILGSSSSVATDPALRLRPRHFWPSSNRAADTGLFGTRQTSSHSRATSSGSLNPSFVSTPNLLRLRSRPYANQPNTHSHSHSHSIPSGHSNHSHASPSENPSDARRRIARLGLIQMQRYARAQTTDTPFNSSSSQHPHRHDPARSNETQPLSRSTLPIRSVSSQSSGSRRASHSASRDPHSRSPSELSSNLVEIVTNSDGWPVPRINDTAMEALSGRFNRPSGFNFERQISRRLAELNTPTDELEPSSYYQRLRAALIRDFAPDRDPSWQTNTSPERQPFREFLPIPTLPSPEFDGVFDFTAPDANEGAFETRPSAPTSTSTSVPSVIRRSPSTNRVPESRQRNASPLRRSSPRPFLRRDFNPEVFAPGPFRNTIQRLHEVNMARESRNNEGQHREHSQTDYAVPSIPPLTFEDDFRASSMYSPDRHETMMDTQTPNTLNRHSPTVNATTDPAPPQRTIPSFNGRRYWFDDDGEWPDRSTPPTRRNPWPSGSRPNVGVSATANRPSDLHNFLSRHPRIEASRLDSSDASHQAPSRGDEDGLNHALEVLRHDGLSLPRSQELINRFHRDRQRETRTTPTSPWGILEQGNTSTRRTADTTANEPPYARNLRRGRPGFVNFDHPGDETETASSISNRDAERARLLRGRRFRMPNYDLGPVFPHGVHEFIRMGAARRGRAMGDYVRDEDFDESYESLLSLAASLGDVKPRSTPDSVIAGLETGLYKDWKTPESDHRCSICLDDYQPDDLCLKLADCSHWLHWQCLKQWLKSASTCPVCRKPVTGGTTTRTELNDLTNEAGPSRRRDNAGGGPSHPHTSPPGDSSGDRPGLSEWLPPWRYNS